MVILMKFTVQGLKMNWVIKKVKLDELDGYDPTYYDARKEVDGTFTLTRVLWWDNKSYTEYQSK
jgi:hypothetical protein